MRPGKGGEEALLIAGKQTISLGPIPTANDGGQVESPKVRAISARRSELSGPIEGAPWYSASLEAGALVVERHDPDRKNDAVLKCLTTAAIYLEVKPFTWPAAKPPSCAKGTLLGNYGACLKARSADASCGKDETCEHVRDVSGGTLGPALGSGCTPSGSPLAPPGDGDP